MYTKEQKEQALKKYARLGSVYVEAHRQQILRRSEVFFHSAVVDTRKFVCAGSHVDAVGFIFSALLINELKHRIISG